MIIEVKVKPNSNIEQINEIGEGKYEIRVSASPDKGKANKAVIKVLSDYFDVPKSSISIKSGELSRNKRIEILK